MSSHARARVLSNTPVVVVIINGSSDCVVTYLMSSHARVGVISNTPVVVVIINESFSD